MVSGKFFYSVAHDLCLPGRFFDYGNSTRARYTTALSVAEVHKIRGLTSHYTNIFYNKIRKISFFITHIINVLRVTSYLSLKTFKEQKL